MLIVSLAPICVILPATASVLQRAVPTLVSMDAVSLLLSTAKSASEIPNDLLRSLRRPLRTKGEFWLESRVFDFKNSGKVATHVALTQYVRLSAAALSGALHLNPADTPHATAAMRTSDSDWSWKENDYLGIFSFLAHSLWSRVVLHD